MQKEKILVDLTRPENQEVSEVLNDGKFSIALINPTDDLLLL